FPDGGAGTPVRSCKRVASSPAWRFPRSTICPTCSADHRRCPPRRLPRSLGALFSRVSKWRAVFRRRDGVGLPHGAHLRRKDGRMTGVRVLVGTRKGAFTLTADGTRKDWTIEGPHFGGWEVYHMNGSPADPNRLWA